MIGIAACIAYEHDLRLVAIAILVCLAGAAGTVQLFRRTQTTRGPSRAGWITLAAVGTGTMVWCTHFVAMMAFHAGVPVTLDPGLTLASLGVAILLAAPGLALAASPRRPLAWVGGAIVGIAISAMHYTGMVAYRVDGIVEWRMGYVVASVLLSSALSAGAFAMVRSDRVPRRIAGGLLLGLAVAALHFTGMAAMRISAIDLHGGEGLSPAAMTALAMATACAGVLFIGCAAVSALIDGQTHNASYRQMRRMALHDGLTDLPNRMSFNEELANRLHGKFAAPCTAVVMLDLARLRSVNDTYGHDAGDQVLIALSARMTQALVPGECVARLGGDEFAALLSYSEPAVLDDFLRRLTAVFDRPLVFERFAVSIRARIGVAYSPRDGGDGDTLLARADLAMGRARIRRCETPCFYDATMDDAVRERRELAGELRDAVAAGAFELHYQVQASPVTGVIAGYEALVRWRHPARGLISPAAFIPLAEEIGEIVPLSDWILHRACRDAALWPEPHVVAVNVSALHLSDPGLVDTVRDALAESGLPPARLALELTESAIIRDRQFALEQLGRLRDMGVGLALDDFGVGYSSLDVLRSFSFDRIKLDASFVAEIDKDEQAVAILHSVVTLGRTLGIPVLAEGVEEPEQLRIVAREGCAAIQGYLIGRPAPALADPQFVRATIEAASVEEPSASMAA